MIIEVAADLSQLAVFADVKEQENVLGIDDISGQPLYVWTDENPVLLTDTARIAALAPGLRDTVFALYQCYPRVVRYDQVEVSWSPQEYPRVWCPSIDTVFFARQLKDYLPVASTIAEVGTGSGFLTKYALTHGNIHRAVASDINLAAVRCASDAIADVNQGANVSLVCPNADDETLGFAGQFDILMCNPPYIPRPGQRNNNPYEGLDLVAKLAKQGQSLLSDDGVMLLNLSTLAGEEPLSWLEQAGWNVKQTSCITVPLKVNAVTSGVTQQSRDWLAFLAEKGRGFSQAPDNGYQYWHDLRFFECRPK